MKTCRKCENGYAMPYYAAYLTFVILPLMILTIDIPRALYVRTHLQTATDAACEAAAQALDTRHYMATGEARIHLGTAAGWAAREFSGTVVDQGIVQYQPALTSVRLQGPLIASCTATAEVDTFITGAPPLNIRVASISETRVSRGW